MFLTRDRGKKRGVAKNARQSRRRFGGALEPMTFGRVGYLERERRDLVSVHYVEALRSPLAGGGSAMRSATSAYFAELLDEWSPEADANETLFRLGSSMVDAIADGVPIEPLARYFEYWLLRLQGSTNRIRDTRTRRGRFCAAARAMSPLGLHDVAVSRTALRKSRRAIARRSRSISRRI